MKDAYLSCSMNDGCSSYCTEAVLWFFCSYERAWCFPAWENWWFTRPFSRVNTIQIRLTTILALRTFLIELQNFFNNKQGSLNYNLKLQMIIPYASHAPVSAVTRSATEQFVMPYKINCSTFSGFRFFLPLWLWSNAFISVFLLCCNVLFSGSVCVSVMVLDVLCGFIIDTLSLRTGAPGSWWKRSTCVSTQRKLHSLPWFQAIKWKFIWNGPCCDWNIYLAVAESLLDLSICWHIKYKQLFLFLSYDLFASHTFFQMPSAGLPSNTVLLTQCERRHYCKEICSVY